MEFIEDQFSNFDVFGFHSKIFHNDIKEFQHSSHLFDLGEEPLGGGALLLAVQVLQ